MFIQVNFHFHGARRCVGCDKEMPFGINAPQKRYCSLRCRDRAAGRRKRRQKKKFVDGLKNLCEICGYKTYKGALDFHHRDPDNKSFNVSEYENYSYDNIRKEVKKCVVLCSNCHSEVHAGILQVE